jgi:hypothetical protein
VTPTRHALKRRLTEWGKTMRGLVSSDNEAVHRPQSTDTHPYGVGVERADFEAAWMCRSREVAELTAQIESREGVATVVSFDPPELLSVYENGRRQ